MRRTEHYTVVTFSDSAWTTLESLAERKGKTISQVLRDAIALEKWFQDVLDTGGRVLVESSMGVVREVIPRA